MTAAQATQPTQYRDLTDDDVIQVGDEYCSVNNTWHVLAAKTHSIITGGLNVRRARMSGYVDKWRRPITATTTEEPQPSVTYRALRDDDIMEAGAGIELRITNGDWGPFELYYRMDKFARMTWAMWKTTFRPAYPYRKRIYTPDQFAAAFGGQKRVVDEDAEEKRRQMKFFFGFERKPT